MKRQAWTEPEKNLLGRYFGTNMTRIALYQKIHEINPTRSYESLSRTIRHWKAKGWQKNKDKAVSSLRVGYLDIETSNLVGDFGIILCWFIKKAGKNQFDSAVITKQEIFDYEFDRRVVTELLKAFENYDILYVHYGSDRRFDVPFIRTRAYENGLEDMLPDYMDKFVMDTYPIARNKLKLHSNRLDSIAEAVGITGVKKTPLSPKQWNLARVGHPEALEYVALHCKRDVQILERVHGKLAKIERPIYRSM